MKTYKKFRKPSKLILACMTRSKSVQIAWILMILINLTHFFIDLLEVFFLLSRKPFHYRSLFKKIGGGGNIYSCLLCCFSPKFYRICWIFVKNRNFRTDPTPKRAFLFCPGRESGFLYRPRHIFPVLILKVTLRQKIIYPVPLGFVKKQKYYPKQPRE